MGRKREWVILVTCLSITGKALRPPKVSSNSAKAQTRPFRSVTGERRIRRKKNKKYPILVVLYGRKCKYASSIIGSVTNWNTTSREDRCPFYFFSFWNYIYYMGKILLCSREFRFCVLNGIICRCRGPHLLFIDHGGIHFPFISLQKGVKGVFQMMASHRQRRGGSTRRVGS